MMSENADCLVLGAGMVGTSTALHLQAKGRDVVLVDRQPAGDGTSFGNAGIIQAEGVVPYLLPRDPLLVLKMLANLRPEAHVHYRALFALAPWLLRYLRHSTKSGVERGIAAHFPLIERCVAEHDVLIAAAGVESLVRRTGYLRVFRTEAGVEKDVAEHKDVERRFGIRCDVLDRAGLRSLEPHLSQDLVGGILFPGPASVSDPSALTKAYADLFRERGGRIRTADATTLQFEGDRWQVATVDGSIAAHDAVVALGPWSADVLSKQGVRVPLAVKRGYHMHYAAEGNATLARPVLDRDNGFVLAPMGRGIRLTTGAEFAYRDAVPTPRQLAAVEPEARRLFPLATRLDDTPWLGARPCVPDMIPVVGPVPGRAGLWANFAHHHLGLTLGPVTGRLLAEMMSGEDPFTDPRPYRVDRF